MPAAPPAPPATRPTRPARSRLAGTVVVLAALTAGCSGSSNAADRASPSTTTTSGAAGATAAGPDAAVADAPSRPPTAAEAALVAARPYTLHEPPQAKNPAPLVVLLHGYGATGATQAAYLKLAAATDAQGMLLAIPDGTLNALRKRFWNATDACCAGRRTDVDDSAYLRAIVADVAAHHAVDPKRVYFVGHSNGGFMSYRMACDHADVVAAIVSLEAATWADTAKCRPTQSVAVLEIHGTADQLIKYDGGAITGKRYPGAQQTVKTWARYDGCSLTPDDPETAAHALELGLPPATVTAYSKDCRGNGHAELWTQADGVHVPALDPTFATQVVAFLLAHPKR
jgi:polyhydroxybutyrate depolymerase